MALRVTRTCEQCGVEFLAKPCLVADGKGKYCSLPCAGLARRKRVDINCHICGVKFSVKESAATRDRGEPKYCSKDCANAANSEDRRPLEERFWSKVDKKSEEECWLWTGGKTTAGYGVIGSEGRKRKQIMATRAIWEMLRGPIPPGYHVCHNCPTGDNPSCVNPNHLFLGTPDDNMKDKVKKGRQNRGESTPSSKLTDDQVREIKRAYREEKARASDMARKYGVSSSAIGCILSGRTWTHIQ